MFGTAVPNLCPYTKNSNWGWWEDDARLCPAPRPRTFFRKNWRYAPIRRSREATFAGSRRHLPLANSPNSAFPSYNLQKSLGQGSMGNAYLALAVGWFGRGGYEQIDGCLPYMVRAGKLRSRRGPPRPRRFGCRGARRTKWGKSPRKTRITDSTFGDVEQTIPPTNPNWNITSTFSYNQKHRRIWRCSSVIRETSKPFRVSATRWGGGGGGFEICR